MKWFHAVGIPVLTPHIDIANVRIEFENGCTANLTASRVSREKMRKIRLFQPDGYLSIDFLSQKVIFAGKKEEVGRKGNSRASSSRRFPSRKWIPLKVEIQSFLQCVRDRKPPRVSGKRRKAGPGRGTPDRPSERSQVNCASKQCKGHREEPDKRMMISKKVDDGRRRGLRRSSRRPSVGGPLSKSIPMSNVFGMGGEALHRAGMTLLYHHRSFSVVGITEVFLKLRVILKALRELKQSLDRERPDLVILVDFPDFNLRLAKAAHRRGIPVLYYISPQVWAWRPGRVKLISKWVRKMIVFFPFEVPIYRAAGVDVEWVGHPLLDIVRPSLSRKEALQKFDLGPERPIVALLPGSRESEIEKLLSTLLGFGPASSERNPNPSICHPSRLRDVSRGAFPMGSRISHSSEGG